MAERLAAHDVSVARLVQHEQNGGAALHVVTHEAAAGDMERALAEIARPAGDARTTRRRCRVDLRARRRGARMGVIEALSRSRALPRPAPIDADTPIVSLGEGGTPLLYAPRLSEELGIELYVKFEGANPTGELQGPRHDDRRLEGAAGRRARGHLRVDREHGGVGVGLRGARRAAGGRARPRGRRRKREAGAVARASAGASSRCAGRSTTRSRSPASSARPASSPS